MHMAASKPVKYMVDHTSPTHIPCKFCGFPAKSYKALCAHLRFCKKRFRTIIVRFVDEDLWIKGNKIIVGIIQDQILEETFDSAYATVKEKKAYFRAVTGLGRKYGKNIILSAEWGELNSFDDRATGDTEIYEV
ncbi:MAG: hypothetical protein PHG61_08230 [Candidatus Marinimicrobia bacterium]|nr:hypothetical protein [Candidatus Neomarinimicrobiota bacterium]